MSQLLNASDFIKELEKSKIRFGVIGGIAVFAYGGERTTFDIDLLIHGDDRDQVKRIGQKLGFTIVNENPEVVQFSGPAQIDIIFANRPASQAMLEKVRRIETLPYPVIAPEDLVGLKIQGFVGDRKREFTDKGDILTIMRTVKDLNFDKIKEYADIFGVWNEILEIKKHV